MAKAERARRGTDPDRHVPVTLQNDWPATGRHAEGAQCYARGRAHAIVDLDQGILCGEGVIEENMLQGVVMGSVAGPDPLSVLSAAIRAVADEGDAPELLIGVLLEGAVYAAHRLPPDRHKEVALAMTRLLAERLGALGLHTSGQTNGGQTEEDASAD